MTDLPVEFTRRAAYLPAADAVVLADVHLGRGRESDVQLPLDGAVDARERLAAALDRFDPTEVVVAGDLLHAFDRLPAAVADAAAAFARTVADAGADLVVTPGNHDTRLADALEGVDAATPASHRLADGTVVAHGHEQLPADAARYVVGHDHPAIEIEGQRHPCFLYGEGVYRGADVLVLPAFDRLARGSTVGGMRGADFMSPVLAGGAGDFRPVVYDDDPGEALAFPPLSALQDHL